MSYQSKCLFTIVQKKTYTKKKIKCKKYHTPIFTQCGRIYLNNIKNK